MNSDKTYFTIFVNITIREKVCTDFPEILFCVIYYTLSGPGLATSKVAFLFRPFWSSEVVSLLNKINMYFSVSLDFMLLLPNILWYSKSILCTTLLLQLPSIHRNVLSKLIYVINLLDCSVMSHRYKILLGISGGLNGILVLTLITLSLLGKLDDLN